MSVYQGKTAIITGGASGIGAAVATELAKRGAIVVLADIDGDRAAATAAAIEKSGGRAHAARLDVADAAAVSELVHRVKKEHGRIDYMFNNAGVAMSGEMRHLTLANWNRMVDINLRGVIHGVHAVYPIMIEQGSGHIVNTASINGLVALPLAGPYNATKHAVVGLSLTLRAEGEGLGVKVSTVCPGFIDTPMKDNMTYIELDKEAGQKALPFKLHPVEVCAAAIVSGVAKNKAVIVITPQAKLLWYLHRLLPGVFTWANGLAAAESRRMRAGTPLKDRNHTMSTNTHVTTQLTQADGTRYTFAAITAQKRAVHEELFRRGTLPDMNAIAGWQYHGWNLSLTALLMGIRRFTKGLQTNTSAPGAQAELTGYNLWIKQQGGPTATWVPSAAHRHGFYKVSPAAHSATDAKHPHALLLDYGRGGNPWYQPSQVLRDYIVQVYADDPTLLIGKAYVALGGVRIFGGNFVMRRSGERSDDRPLR